MKKTGLVFVLTCVILATSGCGFFHKQRRVSYIQKHPELSDLQREQIVKGQLWVGMKPEEVKASLGNPTNVNKDLLGKSETWSYTYRGQYVTRTRYVFGRCYRLEFHQGRLANWRED